jgi:hypothetical protein
MDDSEIREPVAALIGPVVIADGWSVDADGAVVFSGEDPADVWVRFQARVMVSHPDLGIRCPYSGCGWLRRTRDRGALAEYRAHALNNHEEG